MSFKFVLSYALYFPTYKVIDFLNISPIKVLFLKMIGSKIGKNVVLGGDEWIFDPYVTEIGDNSTIGGRSIITGHIGEGHLIIKKIIIGGTSSSVVNVLLCLEQSSRITLWSGQRV